MCGRTTLYHDGNQLQLHFHLSPEYAKHMELRARYNVSPGTDIAAIRAGAPRVLTPLRWGLIPSWAKDPKIGYKMINARGETVHEKPSFRSAFKKRRCIIPASGWFEWRKNPDGSKTPIYFHRTDGGILALAGLWESWKSPEGTLIESCTIITVAAAPQFMAIHDRMPLVLGSFEEWLREDLDADLARAMLTAADVAGIETYPVSAMVNRPTIDSPDCIKPV